MPQLLVLNPSKRRHAKRKAPRSAAQRAATKRMLAANRRASNPAAPLNRRAHKSRRRANPISMMTRRHRRNPTGLGMGGGASVVAMLKNAAISGAGAVAVDLVIGQVNKYLPASLLGSPNQIDQGDAVKAGLTVLLGKLLNKPTRGMSLKAAQASLTVQAYGMISTLIPGTMPLGYSSPGRVVQGNSRIGPNVRQGVQSAGMGRFVPGSTQLLSQYQGGGASPLLNGSGMSDRMAREGVMFR